MPIVKMQRLVFDAKRDSPVTRMFFLPGYVFTSGCFSFRNARDKTFIIESPGINSLHHGTAGLGEQMFAFGNLVFGTVMFCL